MKKEANGNLKEMSGNWIRTRHAGPISLIKCRDSRVNVFPVAYERAYSSYLHLSWVIIIAGECEPFQCLIKPSAIKQIN